MILWAMGTCKEEILNSLNFGKLKEEIMQFGKNKEKNFVSVIHVLFTFPTKQANTQCFSKKKKSLLASGTPLCFRTDHDTSRLNILKKKGITLLSLSLLWFWPSLRDNIKYHFLGSKTGKAFEYYKLKTMSLRLPSSYKLSFHVLCGMVSRRRLDLNWPGVEDHTFLCCCQVIDQNIEFHSVWHVLWGRLSAIFLKDNSTG